MRSLSRTTSFVASKQLQAGTHAGTFFDTVLLVLPWQGIIKVFNAGTRNLSGYSRADEVVGRNVGVFLLPNLATGETGEQLIRSAASLSASGGVEGSTVEVRVATRVGHVRTCNMRVLAQQQQQQQQGKGDNGEEAVYIISLDDVTALQARVEALRWASRNLVITWRLIYIL